ELFHGSIPEAYPMWTPSNYVSPDNKDVYVPIPVNSVPPVNAMITTQDNPKPHLGGPGAVPVLAPDYCQIIRWLWLISGGYHPPVMAFDNETNTYHVSEYPPANQPPPILGYIMDSGAYDAL